MWQDRLKELLYILENSDANEIDVTFLGRRYRVVKEPPIIEDNALKTSLKRLGYSRIRLFFSAGRLTQIH